MEEGFTTGATIVKFSGDRAKKQHTAAAVRGGPKRTLLSGDFDGSRRGSNHLISNSIGMQRGGRPGTTHPSRRPTLFDHDDISVGNETAAHPFRPAAIRRLKGGPEETKKNLLRYVLHAGPSASSLHLINKVE